MGILSRIFKVGQSEAHSMVDKLENPIKMTEQGIRDMKKDLDKSLQALAEVKSMQIRAKREANDYSAKAKSYEQKAVLLIQKAEKGDIEVAEADRLASEALVKKEESLKNLERAKQDIQKFDSNIAQLDNNVKKLKSQISHYENELKTLKARARVSEATKKINKSMSNIDSSSTVSMLERMKDKVEKDEALAEAYGEMATENKSLDDEIDDVLSTNTKGADALAELKAKIKSDKKEE